MRDCPHRDKVAKLFKGNSQPAVLTQPFSQQNSMVTQAPTTPVGGNPNHPSSEEASSNAHIYMFNGIYITNRTTTYDTSAVITLNCTTHAYLASSQLISFLFQKYC
jgi:hypothetical protein